MKIQQVIEALQGVKKLQTFKWPELVQYLQNHYGIINIGAGAFSQVFSRNDWDYVVKVFESDPGYIRFVKFCLENQNNKHLPRIFKKPKQIHQFHKRMKESTRKLWVMKVEKLSELDLDAINREIPGGNLSKGYAAYKMGKRETVFPEAYKKYDLASFYQTWEQIENIVGEDDVIDLRNPDNIMQRSDGTLVFTDPISNLSSGQAWFCEIDYPIWYDNDEDQKLIPSFKQGPEYKKPSRSIFRSIVSDLFRN